LTHPTRFLIIKIGALGDFLYAFPLIESLHTRYPQADIRWTLSPPVDVLLNNNPHLSAVGIVDQTKLFSASRKEQFLEVLRLCRVSAGSYAAVFIGQRDPRYALSLRPFVRGPIYYLVRQQPRGFIGSVLKKLGIHAVVVKPQDIHESYAFRRMVASACQEPDETQIPWRWSLDYIHSPLQGIRHPYWVFHIGGGQNAKTEFLVKTWPHWAELCQQFVRQFNKHLILVGSGAEASNVLEILNYLEQRGVNSAQLHNFVGKTSLEQLVTIVRDADGLVGPDSGPLHLADALGVPVIGLFGATSAITYGVIETKNFHILNKNLSCSPCYKEDGHFPPCPHEVQCMQDITPQEVLACIENLEKSSNNARTVITSDKDLQR
jgi:ADP-heptose:LPS heptosyltransferase